jgi:glycosyltransferase involved in cell wall biosynthesis
MRVGSLGDPVLKDKRIAVVVPCFNEESNIINVLRSIPEFVDSIIVIDDASHDQTVHKVMRYMTEDSRLELLCLDINSGVGAAISKGLLFARDFDIDIVAVMAGDGQMDPSLLIKVVWPIILNEADFTKTNRLFDVSSAIKIPKHRFIGNFILSLFTKIASGYWKISDAQSGYTAIGKKGIDQIPWEKMYPRYGQPNDLLITLNTLNFRVADIHTPPRYNVGENSKMKISKVLFTIPLILWKGFWRRLWVKYVVRDSHPLVILYLAAFSSGAFSLFLFTRMLFSFFISGEDFLVSATLFSFLALFSLQCFSFAMWFDLQANEDKQLTYALDDIVTENH